MLKVTKTYQVIKPGEWKQCIELIHEGQILGFLDRIRTAEVDCVVTRNLFGEIMQGECIEWLKQRMS
jgi:hypothetical protein